MLRRVAQTLLAQVERPAMTAGLTTLQAQSQDYSLAMKKAAEISAEGIKKAAPGEVGACAGVPESIYKRPVRIFVQTRGASQQGFANTLHNSAQAPQWRIAFDNTGKWENPLMGWTSTADPLENVGRATLFFYTKEEAMAFCSKHGWEYEVDEPRQRRNDRQKRFNAYGDKYSTKRAGLPDLSHMTTYASNQKK